MDRLRNTAYRVPVRLINEAQEGKEPLNTICEKATESTETILWTICTTIHQSNLKLLFKSHKSINQSIFQK